MLLCLVVWGEDFKWGFGASAARPVHGSRGQMNGLPLTCPIARVPESE
jgi:hypothetical protein